MLIKKILNNNVVIAATDGNEEVIIMGRGIAFGLKSGNRVDKNKIEKIFSLTDTNDINRFKELVMAVPEECIEMTEYWVTYAKEVLGKKLHDSIYITLTDHFNTMIERAKMNIYLNNTMLWDIRRLHSEEFKIAQEIIGKFNEKYGSIYDDNEAAAITMHFVNASLELDFSSTMKLTKMISDILNIVKYHFKISYDENSLSYYRFVIHLRFFAQRLFSGNVFDDNNDVEFFLNIQKKYQDAYNGVNLIKRYIFDHYEYSLTDEECMYLTIHVAKVVKDSR